MGSWSDSPPVTADAAAPVVDGPPAADAHAEPGYSAAVLADAPSGYWPLDETSGNIARDASGHGVDGKLLGNVRFGTPGAVGTGATFDDADAVEIGDHFDFASGAAFSIEMWMRPTKLDTIYRRVVSKETNTPRNGWFLWVRQSTKGPAFGFEIFVDDTNKGFVGAERPLATASYAHVVVTYDGKDLAGYFNGELLGKGPPGAAIPDTNAPLRWAALSYAGAGLIGDLDELAIYDHALSAERIGEHHRLGTR